MRRDISMSNVTESQCDDPRIDIKLIDPFVDATVNVLKTMAGINPIPQAPRIKSTHEAYGDITGIIGMAGDNVKGSFAVSFTEPCILKIMSNMLGENIDSLSGDVSDGVGEITNIITGGAKAQLAEEGYTIGMATPTVISGKGHSVMHVSDQPVVVVPFETDVGPFFLEVNLVV